jgi:protein-cysteine N-palmitoyltransferase HHAT
VDNAVSSPVLVSVHDLFTSGNRYIYIPLGGSKHVLPNSIIVFSFVALWHDLSFRLLAWGWLVVLFILPELGARRLLARDKVRPFLRVASCS